MVILLHISVTRTRLCVFGVLCIGLLIGSYSGRTHSGITRADEAEKPSVTLESQAPVNTDRASEQALQRKNWIKALVMIQNGHVNQLEELLNNDPSLATRPLAEDDPTTLLHGACKHDQTDAIRMLLKRGADTSAKAGYLLETPLHLAARTDSINAVKLLLAEGVDINIRGSGPDPKTLLVLPKHLQIPVPFASPLDLAAAAGSEQVVLFLLEKGAALDVNPKESSYSALHRAMEGHYNFIGYGNLRRLAEPETRAAYGNSKIIEMLLKNGGDLRKLDFFENTPFHVAVRRGAHETVEYLLKSHAKDVDVEAPGQFGFTPLQLAVSEFRGDRESDTMSVIELLLKNGADRNRVGGPSTSKTTAFKIAGQQKWGEPILKLLRP